jgi:hypothetical protein
VAAGSTYRRFRPRLVLGYQQDLHELIEEPTAMGFSEARAVLDTAIEAVDDRQTTLRTFGSAPAPGRARGWTDLGFSGVV